MVSGNLNMASMLLKPVAAGILVLWCHHAAFAADSARSGFYTIVGPDGQMIVIDRNAASTSAKKSSDTQPSIASQTPAHSSWSLFKHFGLNKKQASADNNPLNANAGLANPPAQSATSTSSSSMNSKTLDNHAKMSVADRVPVSDMLDRETDLTLRQNTNVQLDTTPSQFKNAVENSSSVRQITSPASSVKQPATVASQPITIIDGEQYVDSEYLEQREFNLEGKKRFYNLPDGLGGHEVLAREKGVDMTVFRQQKIDKPQVVDLSKNYQRIPQAQIVALTGTQCFSNKQLKHAKLLRADETLDFWPKPGFEPKFDFVVAKLEQPMSDIQFTSYASSVNQPKFYWPLPVFLDADGCILEGVNAFYQNTLAATPTMHQALQGYLHIPQNTQYILFTPLEAAADLSQTQLTDKGQVRLTPIR